MSASVDAVLDRLDALLRFHTPAAVHFDREDVLILVTEFRRVRDDLRQRRAAAQTFWIQPWRKKITTTPRPMPCDLLTSTLHPVLGEIAREREAQDAQWGGPAFDDTHDLSEWRQFREKCEYQLASPRATPAQMRDALVKLAALAVAQVEAIDRTVAGIQQRRARAVQNV